MKKFPALFLKTFWFCVLLGHPVLAGTGETPPETRPMDVDPPAASFQAALAGEDVEAVFADALGLLARDDLNPDTHVLALRVLAAARRDPDLRRQVRGARRAWDKQSFRNAAWSALTSSPRDFPGEDLLSFLLHPTREDEGRALEALVNERHAAAFRAAFPHVRSTNPAMVGETYLRAGFLRQAAERLVRVEPFLEDAPVRYWRKYAGIRGRVLDGLHGPEGENIPHADRAGFVEKLLEPHPDRFEPFVPVSPLLYNQAWIPYTRAALVQETKRQAEQAWAGRLAESFRWITSIHHDAAPELSGVPDDFVAAVLQHASDAEDLVVMEGLLEEALQSAPGDLRIMLAKARLEAVRGDIEGFARWMGHVLQHPILTPGAVERLVDMLMPLTANTETREALAPLLEAVEIEIRDIELATRVMELMTRVGSTSWLERHLRQCEARGFPAAPVWKVTVPIAHAHAGRDWDGVLAQLPALRELFAALPAAPPDFRDVRALHPEETAGLGEILARLQNEYQSNRQAVNLAAQHMFAALVMTVPPENLREELNALREEGDENDPWIARLSRQMMVFRLGHDPDPSPRQLENLRMDLSNPEHQAFLRHRVLHPFVNPDNEGDRSVLSGFLVENAALVEKYPSQRDMLLGERARILKAIAWLTPDQLAAEHRIWGKYRTEESRQYLLWFRGVFKKSGMLHQAGRTGFPEGLEPPLR